MLTLILFFLNAVNFYLLQEKFAAVGLTFIMRSIIAMTKLKVHQKH